MNPKLMLCLVLIFALLLPACSSVGTGSGEEKANALPPYAVYISVDGVVSHPYFRDDVNSITELRPSITAPNTPAELTKTLKIDSVGYEVEYRRTHADPLESYNYLYMSPDKKVTCQYRTEDMSLYSVSINMELAKFADMDQQQYEQWIKTYISQFTQEDLSKLQLSCQTQYYTLNRSEDGFLKESNDGEAIKGYQFRYEKHLDSVKTSDYLLVSFSIQEDGTMRVGVVFNQHKFDAFDTLNVDEAAVDQAISDYIDAFAGEDVTLTNYEAQDEDQLVMIKGNIMLKRSILITYKWHRLEYENTCDFYIKIPQ